MTNEDKALPRCLDQPLGERDEALAEVELLREKVKRLEALDRFDAAIIEDHRTGQKEDTARIEDGLRLSDKLRAEVERLRHLIDNTSRHWSVLENVLPCDGAIDEAMKVAVNEVVRLRKMVEFLRDRVECLADAHAELARYSAKHEEGSDGE